MGRKMSQNDSIRVRVVVKDRHQWCVARDRMVPRFLGRVRHPGYGGKKKSYKRIRQIPTDDIRPQIKITAKLWFRELGLRIWDRKA